MTIQANPNGPVTMQSVADDIGDEQRQAQEALKSAAARGSVAALRMPRREAWVDVPEYEGFRARLWVNYPRRYQTELRSGDPKRVQDALKAIVLEHNGWGDDQGELLPQPNEDGFWDVIPDELAAALIILLNQESSKLPNSILAKKAS